MTRSQFPDDVLAVADRAYVAWSEDKHMPIVDAIARAVVEDRKTRGDAPVMPTLNISHGVTKQQRALAEFIHAYCWKYDHAPSFDEMKEALGLASKSGVHRLITALEERGIVERMPNRARSVVIAERFSK